MIQKQKCKKDTVNFPHRWPPNSVPTVTPFPCQKQVTAIISFSCVLWKCFYTYIEKKNIFIVNATFITYSWLLNNSGIRNTDPLCSWKSTYNFRFPKILITNSLLLTESLTNNVKHSINTYFVCLCSIYCILKAS